MSPGTLASVVDLTQSLSIGASEPCLTFEVDEDVQSLLDLVQLHLAHEPGGLQPQWCLEKLLLVHGPGNAISKEIPLPAHS